MEEVRRLDAIKEANAMVGKETLHPLVTVIDFSTHSQMKAGMLNLGFYGVFLKTTKDIDLQYGRHQYDYDEGTLIFIAPGQVVGFPKNFEGRHFQPTGWALMFHPDLIRGTSLGRNISEYNFFGYAVHEALHVSEQERQIVIDCFSKIDVELRKGIDKHTKMIIVSNIELFLNYCVRFYDRQFIVRDHVNKDLLSRFEALLDEYFKSDSPQNDGLPSVAYFADKLNLSASYFGDLIKKETGVTSQEYIQSKLIDMAKERILDKTSTVSEIAYELGFKYPQHFTRLFKQKVGQTPNEYRSSN